MNRKQVIEIRHRKVFHLVTLPSAKTLADLRFAKFTSFTNQI